MAALKTDIAEVGKTLELLKGGQLAEIRMYNKKGAITSGYFKGDYANALKGLDMLDYDNCYFVLNKIKDECYSREQHEKYTFGVKQTTSDNDIQKRDWILVDADPKRAAGISSTNGEKKIARARLGKVYTYLQHAGFPPPVCADSGNGYHLLYKVELKNNDGAKALISDFLKSLDMMFSDELVEIDTSVFNASRITKLYGTVARKGANTEERPHRTSKIIQVPDAIEPADIKLIKKIADIYPKPDTAAFKNTAPEQFDLPEFIHKFGIQVKKVSDWSHGTKYVLDCCLFDSSHKAPDACIIQLNNGAIDYKCFHNSCADRTWRDVRLMFEPEAYNRQYISQQRRPNYKDAAYAPPKIEKTNSDGQPVFFVAKDISRMKAPDTEYIKTGINDIDRFMRGLAKGAVSCISGLNGSGKSSWVSQLAIEASEQGYRTALFSGEMTAKNVLRWITLQAAGKQHIQGTQYDNYFVVKNYAEGKITDWLDGKVFIYNNSYGNDFSQIHAHLNTCVSEHRVDLIILDNMMALNITMLERDKYAQQGAFVKTLTEFAKAANIHIAFVAHPRKPIGFLRKDDISGSSDIQNWSDNIFVIHRVNQDFKRLSKQTLNWKIDDPLYECDNVIEICKDRATGLQDVFIPLYFERQSKRLLNSEHEYKAYGWEDRPVYEELEISDDDLPWNR